MLPRVGRTYPGPPQQVESLLLSLLHFPNGLFESLHGITNGGIRNGIGKPKVSGPSEPGSGHTQNTFLEEDLAELNVVLDGRLGE